MEKVLESCDVWLDKTVHSLQCILVTLGDGTKVSVEIFHSAYGSGKNSCRGKKSAGEEEPVEVNGLDEGQQVQYNLCAEFPSLAAIWCPSWQTQDLFLQAQQIHMLELECSTHMDQADS